MTRDRTRTSALPAGVDIVIGDLGDDASVSVAVRGSKAVISAAHGFVGPGNPTPEAVDRDGAAAQTSAVQSKVSTSSFIGKQCTKSTQASSMSRVRAPSSTSTCEHTGESRARARDRARPRRSLDRGARGGSHLERRARTDHGARCRTAIITCSAGSPAP